MCSIGIHEAERANPQRILIDLDVVLDPNLEPQSDLIDEALNYDTIRADVVDLMESRHFDLQETLARDIFTIIHKMPTVIAVRVRTCKPDVYDNIKEAAYVLSDI